MKQGNGKPFAVFSVACSTGKDKTAWVDVLASEGLAKPVMPYLKKGQSVIITCEMEMREYDKKDGSKGFTLTANAGRIRLAGSRENREEGAAPAAGNAPSNPTPKNDFADTSDQVPF